MINGNKKLTGLTKFTGLKAKNHVNLVNPVETCF